MPTEPPDPFVEIRPGHASLVRHRGADLDVGWRRGIPHVDLRSGAAWVRATPDGPGLIVSCGEAHVRVRDGAAVVEVRPTDALVVVASGSVTVNGTWPLPRTVEAGEGVSATRTGDVRLPRVIDPLELAANHMVAENLVRDAIASEVGSPPDARPRAAAVAGSPVAAPPVAAAAVSGPRVDGTPPAIDLTDGALVTRRPRAVGLGPITGPEARPDLVLRGAGSVALRQQPSALEAALSRLRSD